MKEVEVSIKGLIFYFLKHWRSIAVAMLIGAVSLSGLQMTRRVVNSQSGQVTIEPGETLTDSERAYIESVYVYLNELRELNESYRNSLIMSLDSKNVISTELTFMISVDDSDDIEGVEQAYLNYLIGTDFDGYLSDKTGLDNGDISETVTVSCERSRYSSLNFVINIIIVSKDKSGAEEIARDIKTYLDEKNVELSRNGYGHELTEIGSSTYQGTNLSIQNRQLQYLQEIQSRNRTILDTENSITGDQKEYYESLVNAPDNEDDVTNEADIPRKTSVKPSGKCIVIGLLAGAFLMCGIYFFIYILANRLGEDDDVEGLFGIYLIGMITGEDYGKSIYRLKHLGKRTFDFDESVELICTKIKMSVQKDGGSSIGLMGCGIKKNNEKAANDIVDMLKKDGIETVLIDDPIYDSSSAEKLSRIERVVLLEKAGVTYRTEIWKEIEMIKKLGIKVDGLIVAE